MPIGIYKRINPLTAFLSKFKVGNGCWEWNGAIACGYGILKVKGTNIGAHRFSYKIFKGKIPKNLFVLHVCDNRICVKPTHLKVGTQKENMKDCIERGRICQGDKHWKQILSKKSRSL
jgi:hypothetical protein